MDNGASSYRRFLCGDDNGISEIVFEYKDGLILYLNSYVNNVYIAEELAEDTFFRLLTKKPRFSQRCSFKTWLYSIGRNVAVDYIRQSKRLSSIPLDEIEGYISDEEGLERAYIKEERKIAVHKALSQLPPDYRTVLWLVYFDGFSNSEAAKVMKKSDRQIKNLLYRAKQSVKTILEKDGFIYEEQ